MPTESVAYQHALSFAKRIVLLYKHLNEVLDNSMSEIDELKGLDKEMNRYLRKWDMKGASLTVMRNDSLLYTKGYGWADEQKGIEMERPNNAIKENKMGVMPVNKLLISMAVPMMMSMMVQALYNIVDSVFVSKLSQDALNAVSLAFPVQNLTIAVGAGTAVGINALLSRSLGQKDQNRADKTAMNGIFLALCSAVVFTLLGLFGARAFFAVQTDIQGIGGRFVEGIHGDFFNVMGLPLCALSCLFEELGIVGGAQA